MKRLIPLIAAIIAYAFPANAQFLDQFEKLMDRLTGYEEPSATAKTIAGNPYGANPGITLTCSKAGVKGDMAYLLFTLAAPGNEVEGITVSSSDPVAGVRFNTPQVADSAAVFVVSPAYTPGKKGKKSMDDEMINVALPKASFSIPSGEAVDVMVVYYGFPKKVKKLDRFDIQMSKKDENGSERFFGFTLDNVALKRTRK